MSYHKSDKESNTEWEKLTEESEYSIRNVVLIVNYIRCHFINRPRYEKIVERNIEAITQVGNNNESKNEPHP